MFEEVSANALTPEEWRRARGMSLEEVAEKLNCDPRTWKKYEEKPSLIPVGMAADFVNLVRADRNMIKFLP